MDEVVVRQLTRQLKLLNFWITFFGVLFLICFAVGGFFLYKAYTEIHKAETSIVNVQQKASNDLNLQQQLCSNTSLSSLLNSECK